MRQSFSVPLASVTRSKKVLNKYERPLAINLYHRSFLKKAMLQIAQRFQESSLWGLLVVRYLLSWIWFVMFHVGRLVMDLEFKSILITGGSSGIGKALALALVKRRAAREGASKKMTLILTGRNEEQLKEIKEQLQSMDDPTISSTYPLQVVCKSVDVSDAQAMKNLLQTMDNKYELDLVIANAGVGEMTIDSKEYWSASKDFLSINVLGVLNTILPAIKNFQDQLVRRAQRPHIAVIGSLASFLPITHDAYSASKCAVRCLCDDLRPQLRYWAIDLTFVAPGFVDTPIHKSKKNSDDGKRKTNPLPKFAFVTAEQAALFILDGLEQNLPFISFPKYLFIVSWLFGSLHPIALSFLNRYLLLQRFKKKKQKLKVTAEQFSRFILRLQIQMITRSSN
ncbi:short-chain dehydrogenase/reductase family protein [Reticulomyxa filosa]|uniref:Short-chain dehydrogenase/reductase family protein n=1 Tax=Reticulomyxa filosa TaxID=46433 RepID=X6MM17_RETFI|nr:short-chain dehydrogenase/reductase family protein [Reticulomyxa filosa]|eukprot:ETO14135.1 short-chain dehydrogenase/reductase family protein [Reticulomyxa filosa]